jgi:hypothetical protein
MEILIQNSDTKFYFKEHQQWVENAADARVFRGPLDALQFCVEHQLKGVQLGFRYHEDGPDVHFSGLRCSNPATAGGQVPPAP